MDKIIKDRDRNEILVGEASMIMSRDILRELIDWYNEILDYDAQYIVFLVRRCYVLALILESLTGRKMEDTENKKFLTDSAALLQIDTVYREYKKSGGKTPTILVVDDILVHGRNINNLIRTFVNRFYDISRESSKRSDEELREKIEREILRSIRINVFYCTDQPLLLNEKYWPLLHEKRRVADKEWRRLSNDLSTLITYGYVTYASYVFSRGISAEKFEVIKTYFQDYEKTIYRNNVEYTKINYVKDSNDSVLAISTVRLIKNNTDGGFRVAPFLFLPMLSESETLKLVDRINDAGYKNTDLKKWWAELYRVNGRRMSSELLTMVLSNIVLNDFMDRVNKAFPGVSDIFDIQDEPHELAKLARNYNSSTFEKTYDRLKEIISIKTVRYAELEKILKDCVTGDRELIKDSGAEPSLLDEALRVDITENIENLIYEQGWNDEQEAKWISAFPFYETPFHFRRKNLSCYETFKTLYGYREDEPLNRRSLLDYSIRIFLQMMDCGVIAVSSYPPVGKDVLGLEQYEKAGEQSMTLLPIRYLLYLPMLSRMESVAKAKQIPLHEEAERYFKVVPFEDDRFEQSDIIAFIDKLTEVEQSVSDWNDDYVGSAPYLRSEKGEDDTIDFYLKQHDLVTVYEANRRKYR